VLFVFDDILDFSVAKLVGVRMMIKHQGNPLTIEYATKNRLVDYVTANDGGNNGIREVCELILLLTNNFQKVVEMRTKYSPEYKHYIATRAEIATSSFTAEDDNIIPQ
jgi:3-deoxy-D-manno-octulosonate 8-phosphate phosphatase (KDO 8-P phosphatase)